MRFNNMMDVDIFVTRHPALEERLSDDVFGAAKIEIRPYIHIFDDSHIAQYDPNGVTLFVGDFPNRVMAQGDTLEEAYFNLGRQVIDTFGDYESIEYVYESEEE